MSNKTIPCTDIYRPVNPPIERRTASECVKTKAPRGLPSPRAMRAYALLQKGLTTKQIAKKLKTSPGQIQNEIVVAREHARSLR